MYKVLILFVMLFVGCDNLVTKQYPKDDFKTEISCVIVRNSILNPETLEVVDKKYKRADCPECKGTGRLKSGDGLSVVDCNYCEPPTSDNSSFKVITDNLIEAAHVCCEDCICGDNCQCTYPGECLVKKNKGWAVSRCDESGCRVYYPHGPNGQYNPYEQGWAIGQINKRNSVQYQKYSKPIPVDVDGNPLLQSSNSKACATCR